MDWRSGRGQSTSSPAFRGGSPRGRGRGRGRGGHPSNNRGGAPVSPVAVSPAPVQEPSTPKLPSTPSTSTLKTPSRKNSQQTPHKSPSLNSINNAKPTPNALSNAAGTRPSVTQRSSQNSASPSVATVSDPTDSAQPSMPNSSRPKATRKRSHNRNRSSSKASTTGGLSAPPSLTSLGGKDRPPHLPIINVPPASSTRTDIDALVERVRAMAMAGSAIERDKDKDKDPGRQECLTATNSHFDWASEQDDSLPDLDDWMKPKVTEEPKPEPEIPSEPQVLPTLEELPVAPEPDDNAPSEGVEAPVSSAVPEAVPNGNPVKDQFGKNKTRGRHTKKKNSQEVNGSSSTDGGSTLKPPDLKPPTTHPLPPKPEVTAPSFSKASTKPEVIRTSLIDRIRNDSSLHAAVIPIPSVVSTTVNTPEVSGKNPKQDQTANTQDHFGVDNLGLPPPQSAETETPNEAAAQAVNAVPKTPPINIDSTLGSSQGWIESVPPKPLPTPRSAPPNAHQHTPSQDRTHMSPPRFSTRSQVSSPERRIHNLRHENTFTHQRTRSSPQPATRTHASRPIISVDAISRLSRTLGVGSTNTSPRKPPVELSASEQPKAP